MRNVVSAIGIALGAGMPSAAHACSVCGIGPGPSNTAFMISTIFLSFLPIGAIAGGLLWLRANARQRLAGEFEERDPRVPRPAAPAAETPATPVVGIRPLEAR